MWWLCPGSSARRRIGSPRHGLPVLLALLLSHCAPRPPAPALPDRPAAALRVRVGEGSKAVVRTLDMEEYIAGSLLAEGSYGGLGPDGARRMMHVQAIVARTYATASRGRHASEGFDLCSTTHCQLYRPHTDWPDGLGRLAREAAADTRGRIIVHEGRPIEALFHSDCGGGTSAATIVWGGPTPPYLAGVSDPFCRLDAHDDWQFHASVDEIRAALNADPRTRVGGRLERIEIVRTDEAGRIVQVALRGERSPVARGEEIRSVLTRRFGARSIRSARFEVERSGSEFAFRGTGFGHGVGLCQTGAMAQADNGRSAEDIIAYYYPGTSITGRRTR